MSALKYHCVSDELVQLINVICNDSFFNEFRLFGGTALALQLGHRISVDADFICDNTFKKKELTHHLEQIFPDTVSNIVEGDLGVFAKVGGIKIDFLSWNKPFIRPQIEMDDIRLMHVEEIAAHKLYAILNRGEKKDYVDIACLLDVYSLADLLQFYKEKYNGSNSVQIIKYLLSYSDIDFQPMPQMIIDMDWPTIKDKLQNAVWQYTDSAKKST